MLPRIRDALLRPGRWLAALEREGRAVWSLAAVDLIAMAVWVYALNGFFFHRRLDSDDWSTLLLFPLLCQAACLGYRLRPGRPAWGALLRAAAGQLLACLILRAVFPRLAMDLSPRELTKLFAAGMATVLASRLFYLGWRRRAPWAPLECLRLALAGGAAFFCFGGRFLTSASVGSGDSYWYCIMIGDFVRQLRAGVFPIFVGQSEYAFNGAVSPLRFAPALQHLAGLIDLATGRSLPFHSLQNLTLAVCGLAGVLAAYGCAAALAPRRRWTALAVAVLYLSSPGVLCLGYQGDLFMSMTALPVIPFAAYGLWRTLEDERGTSIAWTVLPVAAAWYCHPPIALWLTFLAAGVQLALALRRWREPGLYARWAWGAALFALAAGYLFTSVLTLRLPSTGSEVEVILQSVRGAFPACLLPVSNDINLLSDYQLGWGLDGLLLAAAALAIFRPRRSLVVLLLGCGALLLLLTPVPALNAALWRHLPRTVRDVTYHWPMQRFYPILAGFAAVIAAAALARLGARWRLPIAALLALAVAWSVREGAKFVFHDYILNGPAPAPLPDRYLDPDNIVLTRYAFNPFPFVPPYFSHGYMDPYLENRILAPDLRTELAGNAAAARPGDDAAAIPLAATFDGVRVAVLTPFAIAPGVRYAVRFVPTSVPASGSLLVTGTQVERQYFLPDSAMGMIHRGKARSFGFLPGSRDFFPLWTSGSKPEVIQVHYAYDAPPASVPPLFARAYLRTYTPASLPVRVSSWMPYTAALDAPAAGDWLETPRLYIPGYAASVNGQPAEVASSASGLVAVRLAQGANEVVLRYPGPLALRVAFWVSALTWAGALAAFIRGRLRRRPFRA